jgi:hypothetical protein
MGTLRGVWEYRAADKTETLNEHVQDALPKGVLSGGTVAAVSGELKVTVAPFVAMATGGMTVLHETSNSEVSITASIVQWVLLKAIYGSNQAATLVFESLSTSAYTALTAAEKAQRLKLGKVTADGSEATDIDFDDTERIDPMQRGVIRGTVADVGSLPSDTAWNRDGDVYLVLSNHNLYAWDSGGAEWIVTTDALLQADFDAHIATGSSDENHLSDDQYAGVGDGVALGGALTAANPVVTSGRTFAEPETVDINGLSGAIWIDMPSDKYYIGEGTTGTAQAFFRLMSPGGITDLLGSDGNPIGIDSIYEISHTTELKPDDDSENGYYTSGGAAQRPAIKLDFSQTADTTYTGDVDVACGVLGDIGTMPDPVWINYGILQNWTVRQRESTFVVTDDSAHTGGDYNGVSALDDALQALEAGNGGTVFVRHGDYTMTNTTGRTYTKPITIICEGQGQTSGERCRITMSNTSGTAWTFQDYIKIVGLDFVQSGGYSTILIDSSAPCHFDTVFVSSGQVQIKSAAYGYWNFVQLKSYGTNVAAPSTRFPLHLGLNGSAVSNFHFINCDFDGSVSAAQDAAGMYIDDGTLSRISFKTCIFRAYGDYQAIGCDAANGLNLREVSFNDCQMTFEPDNGAASAPFVDFVLDTECNLKLKNVRFQPLGAGDVDEPFLHISCVGNDNSVGGNGIYVDGLDNALAHPSEEGLIHLDTGASAIKNNHFYLKDVFVKNIGGGATAANSIVVGVDVLEDQCSVVLDHLVINDWGTPGTAASCVNVLAAGDGVLRIKNAELDGTDLSTSQSFRGIYGAYALSAPGGLYIEDSSINNFRIGEIVTNGGKVTLRNVSGVGDTNQLTSQERWDIGGTGTTIVMGCQYDNSGGSATTPILSLPGGAGQSGVIMGNMLIAKQAADNAIQIAAGADPFTIIGNNGVGDINVEEDDDHWGVGDTQTDSTIMNGLTVTRS